MSDEFWFYFDCVGFWGLGFFNSLDSVDEHIISLPWCNARDETISEG